jgi:hypothetical protein
MVIDFDCDLRNQILKNESNVMILRPMARGREFLVYLRRFSRLVGALRWDYCVVKKDLAVIYGFEYEVFGSGKFRVCDSHMKIHTRF